MVELLLLAVALAIDAAAVCAALASRAASTRTLAAAAVLFGLFQGGMSAVGALGGSWLASVASAWDHWVAFALLALVGGRMVLGTSDADAPNPDPGPCALLALAVATSIDALASGVALPMMQPPLWLSLLAITLVTTALSGLAAALASRLAASSADRAERIGGLVLIAIGLRVLYSHIA